MQDRELFRQAADHAADFLETLETRPVRDQAEAEELYASLGGPLPEDGLDDRAVLAALVEAADPGLVASQSGRYFGFVVGGSLPAATAADWLATAWDVNAGGWALGGAAMVVEEVARGWIAELLGLPSGVSAGFVTGCQMAHVTALAAARHQVLARVGWDVAADGLTGAPRLRVVVGEKRHVTVDRALRLLGIGASSLVVVPADDQGRMRVEELPDLAGGPTIVCGKAGEVNTGSIDDLEAIADAAEGTGAWFHVDGAFGLWAAASPQLRHLVRGVERADSWATDCHKWLNVPYDSGLAFVADPEAHRGALSAHASYRLVVDDARDPTDWTPEWSRRARGFAIWAALRALGRAGVAALVERSCAHAHRLVTGIGALPGAELLAEPVINQGLVRFLARDGGHDGRTDRVVAALQSGGEAWFGGVTWRGMRAMRVSVSSWRTTDEDVDRAIEAVRAALA